MHTSTPVALSIPVDIRGKNLELPEHVRALATEKASRLFNYSPDISHIHAEVEEDPQRGENERYVAKGQVEFGGPALLASVTSDDPAKALDYLFDSFAQRLLRRRAR